VARIDRIEDPAYPRRGRLALAALVALATAGAAACGGEASRRALRRAADADAVAESAPRARWPHAAALDRLRVVRDAVRSSHLVGEPTATIRVNDAADAYGRAGTVLPAGALLVVSHEVDAGPLHFAMERAAEGAPWEYAVVDVEGWILARGRIATCVRCHEEAPRDEVFGPPGL
jgi:hypothetical protein